jgi:hypothetical protein
VHLAGLENDSRCGGIGHLAGLPHQRVKLVDSEEVSECVDRHVSIDARGTKPIEKKAIKKLPRWC